jgi:hypothetical protein
MTPTPAVTTTITQAPSALSQLAQTHCLAVAKQRADDAAANGLDRDTQRVVHDGTYSRCMTWQAAHPAN